MNTKLFSKLFCFLLLALMSSELKPIMRGVWLPYWKWTGAIEVAEKHLDYIDQVSPFSYEIKENGHIINKFKMKKQEWIDFSAKCRHKNIKIIPTIFSEDTKIINSSVSDQNRDHHINQIMAIVLENKFDGININYERIYGFNMPNFLKFMQKLSKKLHERNLVLFYTMSGRISDTKVAINPIKLVTSKSQAKAGFISKFIRITPEYKKIIAESCDQVIVMGYDEWGIPCRYSKDCFNSKYYLSHASDQWVDQIIKYALSYIPAKNLLLGIPTYGLEFKIYHLGNNIKFKKVRGITLRDAIELAKTHNITPKRTSGGELSFTYKVDDELRYVCFLDEYSIRNKISSVKKYGLKGFYIFRLDGTEPDEFWREVIKP